MSSHKNLYCLNLPSKVLADGKLLAKGSGYQSFNALVKALLEFELYSINHRTFKMYDYYRSAEEDEKNEPTLAELGLDLSGVDVPEVA